MDGAILPAIAFVDASGHPDPRNRRRRSSFGREVETYVLADFDEDLVTNFVIEALPGSRSRALADGEWWAYLRREV